MSLKNKASNKESIKESNKESIKESIKESNKESNKECDEEYDEECDERCDEGCDITKNKKKYKTKLCFNDYCLQIEENKINILNLNEKIQTYFLKIKEYEKQKYEIEKNNYVIIQKLETIYTKNNSKKKSNYKGNINGGFNKSTLVPQVLINFLNLENDIELSRPKVGSLLTNKLKELGLKNGQYINLNLDIIKVLNLDESYLNPIKQTHFQTFLATFYK